MSEGKKVDLDTADAAAWVIWNRIKHCCAGALPRCMVAGSIRRCVPMVGDIDIVAEPDFLDIRDPSDLCGRTARRNQLLWALGELRSEGLLLTPPGVKNAGDRMHRYILALDELNLPVQVFMVLPPAQWGVLVAIRTGPAEHAKALVTGALHQGRRVFNGAIYERGSWAERKGVPVATRAPLETPMEEDFYKQCGVAWVPPPRR